jgi:hypothetical protein
VTLRNVSTNQPPRLSLRRKQNISTVIETKEAASESHRLLEPSLTVFSPSDDASTADLATHTLGASTRHPSPYRIHLFADFGYMSSREPARMTSRLGRCCPVAAAYGFRPTPSLTCGSRRAPSPGGNRGEGGGGGGEYSSEITVAQASPYSRLTLLLRFRFSCLATMDAAIRAVRRA